jgi:mRNA-decapping enzyme subunit 2
MVHASARVPAAGSAQPNDPHRSTLLDMFKQPTSMSPAGSESAVKQGKAKASAAFVAKVEAQTPAYRRPTATAADALAYASEIVGAPLRMNAEVNLPYRGGVQILGRQKQSETVPSRNNSSQSGMPSPKDRPYLRQMDNQDGKSPRVNYAAQAASFAYNQAHPSHPSSLSSLSNLHGLHSHQSAVVPQQPRQDHNPEQKQKLLSLFGKAQQSPTGFQHDTRSSTPRSRLASLASASGDVTQGSASTSRRGSQTPISPAERNFLLSYLESAVSSANR